MSMENTSEYAAEKDREDALRDFRAEFIFPQHDGGDCIYFCGNSLGLQPKGAAEALNVELEDWARYAVEGHFHARNPWYSYHELFTESSARLVGAKPEEVVLMNGLTTNLHLLMASFYRPDGKRRKILCEAKAFPSDQYALDSQARFHGYEPRDVVVEVHPRVGEQTVRMEDVLFQIDQFGDELALVMIGAVNYYSGQFFDLPAITKAAHGVGANCGFDLAHAAGNVPLELHDWGVDFAAWCTYKYLNSGPGSVSGCFVHERHLNDPSIPRFEGWWGHDKDERFKMDRQFKPMASAEAWQLSNAPVFNMAVHRVALNLFDRAGMDRIRTKSLELSSYLEMVIMDVAERNGQRLEIITPRDPKQRGSQVSVVAHGKGRSLFDGLMAKGVFIDWREPNVMRMAPVPLYNSFHDVYRFGQILSEELSK